MESLGIVAAGFVQANALAVNQPKAFKHIQQRNTKITIKSVSWRECSYVGFGPQQPLLGLVSILVFMPWPISCQE